MSLNDQRESPCKYDKNVRTAECRIAIEDIQITNDVCQHIDSLTLMLLWDNMASRGRPEWEAKEHAYALARDMLNLG